MPRLRHYLCLASRGNIEFFEDPFVGSYRLTYFDLLTAVLSIGIFFSARLWLQRNERDILWALLMVIATRILSLLLADIAVFEQVLSLFRYVGTGVIIFAVASLLSSPKNRQFFLAGIICGVVLETASNLVILALWGGEERGIWLGVDNYQLQVFLLLFCILSLLHERKKGWLIASSLVLLLGLVATQTRSAYVMLLVVMVLSPLLTGKKHLRTVLVILLLSSLAIYPILSLLPEETQSISDRLEQLWAGSGVVGLRLVLFQMALTAYLQHPITGIGSGGFARQQDYLYIQTNAEYDPDYAELYGSLSTHNTVLGVAAETGTIGLLAYFFWVAVVLRTSLVTLRRASDLHDRMNRYVVSASLCLIALMLQDWWGQASFMPFSSCLLGFLLGWLQSQESTEPKKALPALCPVGSM